MKFSVQITKTITTRIEVEAKNSTDARAKIREYGLTEAANDFPVISETVRVALGFAVPEI